MEEEVAVLAPVTDPADAIIRWSVRIALLLYVLALALRMTRKSAMARWLGTLGLAAFGLHVAAAFHFSHNWSHANAVDATARQTAAVVGWNWGGGVWVNYLFAGVWLADVAWWWRDLQKYEARSRGIEWAVQGFLGFIAFNATVVFADGVVRWIGIAACVALGIGARVRPARAK